LQELVDSLSAAADRARKLDLHETEMALAGNAGNPSALDDLERQLRSLRARILSELAGILQNGIMKSLG